MVSDDWMILSQDELKKNSGIFGSDNPMFAHTDKNILFAMKQKIENGELEVFMSTSPADLLFVSNVNVAKQIGRIPTDINSANQLCSQLPALYTKEFGKPVQFDRCGLETIGGRQVIHIVGPGMLPDTTTVQYFMQQSQNEMLLFTGTFKTQSSEDERKEFDSIVDSVKF